MSKKIKVGVIFGGKSGEHEISLISARSVMNAMDKEKYEIIPIGIDKQGRWLTGGDPMAELESRLQSTEQEAGSRGQGAGGRRQGAGKEVWDLGFDIRDLDVVFPVLHGPFGEDGTVQGLLELADIPYVGCGVAASALGMDKSLMKEIFRAKGLPVVPFRVIKRKRWDAEPEAVTNEVEAALGYPCFVKPANLGSSVGVNKAHDRQELVRGLDDAARYDRKLLVEWAVPAAREIEVSVLGNDDPIASVPGEIIPSREFYSYEAKYIDDGDKASKLLIPAPLPQELSERARELALAAYLALDCAGMARVDFLLDGERNELYVSELNTIPGFTAISMYPKLWEASGIPYPELIDRLIELALERYEDKKRCQTSYSPPEV